MRLANNIVQAEKSEVRDDWEFLWHRLAEVYVYKTGPNGMINPFVVVHFLGEATPEIKACLRALGTSANRVGDVHEGLNIGDLVKQYRRAYVALRDEFGKGKIPNAKLKQSFALIKTKGNFISLNKFLTLQAMKSMQG